MLSWMLFIVCKIIDLFPDFKKHLQPWIFFFDCLGVVLYGFNLCMIMISKQSAKS